MLLASAGVDQASHVGRLEKRRFLVNECHESQCFRPFLPAKTSGEGKQTGHAAGIVIGARCALDRIVVSAYYYDVVSPSANFGFDVMTSAVASFEGVAPGL